MFSRASRIVSAVGHTVPARTAAQASSPTLPPDVWTAPVVPLPPPSAASSRMAVRTGEGARPACRPHEAQRIARVAHEGRQVSSRARGARAGRRRVRCPRSPSSRRPARLQPARVADAPGSGRMPTVLRASAPSSSTRVAGRDDEPGAVGRARAPPPACRRRRRSRRQSFRCPAARLPRRRRVHLSAWRRRLRRRAQAVDADARRHRRRSRSRARRSSSIELSKPARAGDGTRATATAATARRQVDVAHKQASSSATSATRRTQKAVRPWLSSRTRCPSLDGPRRG
jgi:hypothetical protein